MTPLDAESCSAPLPSSDPPWPGGSRSSPLVDVLGAAAQFPQAQLPQPELRVLGEPPPLRRDALQPPLWDPGEVEVTDGGVLVVPDPAGAGGRHVPLRGDRQLVLARIQEPPEIPISHCGERGMAKESNGFQTGIRSKTFYKCKDCL